VSLQGIRAKPRLSEQIRREDMNNYNTFIILVEYISPEICGSRVGVEDMCVIL